MEPMQPSVMVKQVMDIPGMTRDFTEPFDHMVRSLLTPLEYLSPLRVYITGDGDSFHASHAAELAFENIASLPCEPMSAQRFLDYGAEWMPNPATNTTLVIAISASGRTQRVVQAIERARQYGALTVALTGTPGSPVTEAAHHSLVVQIPDLGQSPGIRTFNANLMGLYLIAIRFAEMRNRLHQIEANTMREELAEVGDVIEATIQAVDGPAREAATALRDAESMMWVGSGPSYGTALFSAAKVVEAAGVFAIGQDLEEWWHVERFAYPSDMPVFVIAPPGRSHWRAVDLAGTAKALGRRVIAVVQEGDTEVTQHADMVFPVVGEVREEFSPLVYSIAANLFGSYLAEAWGRMLFQSDNPTFRQAVADYYATANRQG